MKRRNICFFTPVSLNSVGGGERVLTMISSYLSEQYNVSIICYDYTTSFFKLSSKVHVISLGLKRTPNSIIRKIKPLFYLLRFRKIIKSNHFDKIIALSDIGSIFVAISLMFYNGGEKISWLHNSYFEPQHPVIRWLRLWALKRFSKLIVLNRIDSFIYRHQLPKTQVLYIPNPLTLDIEFTENQVARKKKLISVGRLNKLKGFDLLIYTVAPVLKCHPDWSLDIYGQDDGIKMELLQLVEQLQMHNQIFIHNPVSDIHIKYEESSIFLFASYFECCPLVLLEAGLFSLPIVAYDNPSGIPDLIIDQHTGFLIENGDKHNFQIALTELIENVNLREVMGANAFKNTLRYRTDFIIKNWGFLDD